MRLMILTNQTIALLFLCQESVAATQLVLEGAAFNIVQFSSVCLSGVEACAIIGLNRASKLIERRSCVCIVFFLLVFVSPKID